MPGDINEQEADSIADRIMRMPEPANQSAAEVRQMTHVPDNRIMLPDFHLKSHGSGQPLPKQERAFFESRFDHDFSQVQIHADATATESAKAIGAKAYTIGQNIAFGPGHYNPGTSLGRRLIAHELTHVIQQQGSGNDGSLIQRDDDDPYHGSPDPDQRPSPPLTHNPQKNFDPDNPYDIDHSGGLKWDKGELVPAPCIDDSCYDDSWLKKFEPKPNEKSDAEKECPEDKWNRVWQICCPGKQYYNEDTKNCEEPSTPPIRTPNYCIPPTQWNPIKQSCCPGNLPSFNPISGECEPAYSPNPAGIPRNEGYHECPLSQWDLINHQCCPIDAPHFNFETFKCEPWIKLSLNVPTPQPPNLQPPKPYEP
jgi:hypothetical protein